MQSRIDFIKFYLLRWAPGGGLKISKSNCADKRRKTYRTLTDCYLCSHSRRSYSILMLYSRVSQSELPEPYFTVMSIIMLGFPNCSIVSTHSNSVLFGGIAFYSTSIIPKHLLPIPPSPAPISTATARHLSFVLDAHIQI